MITTYTELVQRPLGSRMAHMIADINNAVDICHGVSVEAGWWHNEEGVHLTTVPYYNELKIAQIHGEVSEMLEGIRKGQMDTHCPEFTNEAIEAADVYIRHLDYCGARGIDLGAAVAAKMRYNVSRQDHTPEARKAPGGKRY